MKKKQDKKPVKKEQGKTEPENKLPPKQEKIQQEEEEEKEHPGNIHEENKEEEKLEEIKQPEKTENIIELNEAQKHLEKIKEKYNINITNNAAKSLEGIMNDIKEDYNKNKIQFGQNQKDIEKILEKNESKNDHHINQEEKYIISKRNLKKLRELKIEKENLEKKIQLIEIRKKTLEEEGKMNLNEVDRNIQIKELREIKESLYDNKSKLSHIEYCIKDILAEENNLTRDEKIKEFLNNFERDKEIIEIKSKDYFKKYKEKKDKIKQKEKEMKKIIESEQLQLIENKKKQLDLLHDKAKERRQKEKEKREELKKKEEEKEKEAQEKLKQLQEEKKFKDRTNMKEKDYLYSQFKEQYLKNKENEINDFLLERKKKNEESAISHKELKEFTRKCDKDIQEQKKKHEEDKKHLLSEWKNRNALISKYKTNLFQSYDEERRQLEKMEEEKMLEKKKSYEKKIWYSKEKIEKPVPSEKLRKIREDNIKKITEKPTFKPKKRKIILNKPPKYTWELKLEEIDINNPLGTSVEIQKAINKKPKKYYLIENKNIVKPEKKIDYLEHFIKERAETEQNYDSEDMMKKWDRIVNNKNNSIETNLNNVQEKANLLERKAIENENILRINGGIEKNPALSKKVSNYLIDSIHAKLSMIDNMGKK